MADQVLDQIRDIAEGQIDFEGQRLSEQLSLILMYSVSAVSVLAGYLLQDIRLCMLIVLGGTALTGLIVIPPWPFYKNNPVKWLPLGSTGAPKEASIPQTIVYNDNVVG
ncbi:microsomal signal peptidase 12kda subunit [Ophiostoma piceae UAMH 11346]|uniref:Signal peptidase complex subunit 1 n=1 Tax=Ophiostoma piceae (strain UAMH 11346) TaxID=1262450 RepID=S3C5X2_OPHP1|nr:microsomal signal peptidase 12kda subunit [Ophiostoma piceae UAMH 11346]